MKTAYLAAAAAFALAAPALAQAPAAPPAPPPPLAIPQPHYISIVQEIDVNRPAAAVWARIGKYCGIQEWFGVRCEITSGKEDELGAVRTLNGQVVEILVARTDLSYTYTQPVRVGAPYNLYHGTIEAKPTGPNTSKLVYSLVFDNSMLPDEAARERDRQARATRFMGGLRNMKTLAEGGTLPPPATPAR